MVTTSTDKLLRCWRCDRRLPIEAMPKLEPVVITCPRCRAKNILPRST